MARDRRVFADINADRIILALRQRGGRRFDKLGQDRHGSSRR